MKARLIFAALFNFYFCKIERERPHAAFNLETQIFFYHQPRIIAISPATCNNAPLAAIKSTETSEMG